jgi:hypothetical protein
MVTAAVFTHFNIYGASILLSVRTRVHEPRYKNFASRLLFSLCWFAILVNL